MAAASSSILGVSLFSGKNLPGTLSFRHPEYERRWWWWEFSRVSYVGGREYYEPARLSVEYTGPASIERSADGVLPANVTAYYRSLLFRHARETETEFEQRRKKAYYYNFVAPVVNSLVSHATKKKATRQMGPSDPPPSMAPPKPGEDKPPAFGAKPATDGEDAQPSTGKPPAAPKPKPQHPIEEWWEAVDEERQTSIDQWMMTGLRWAQIYGIYWACMDVDPDGDGLPYVYWAPPQDVIDWHTDAEGIVWLKQFILTEQERASWKDELKPVYRFRIWYRDRVEEYQADDRGGEVLLSTRPHNLGRVPWEPLYSRRVTDYTFPDGVPLVGDLCKVANNVYQLCSWVNELFGDQTFSQLVIPDPTGKLDKVQLGTKRFLGFDPQGQGGEPKYMSPDPEQARVLMEGIGMAIELARQMAGVGRGRSEGSKQKSSAEALELESDDKRSILSDIAAEAQDFERRLARMFLQLKEGAETDTDDLIVTYSEEFDVRGFEAEINEVLALSKVEMPPAIMAEFRKELIRRKFGQRPADELERLLATVDADVQRIEAEKEEMRKAELDSLTKAGNTAGKGPPNGNPKPQGGRPPGP